jgi:hypothetical protein
MVQQQHGNTEYGKLSYRDEIVRSYYEQYRSLPSY